MNRDRPRIQITNLAEDHIQRRRGRAGLLDRPITSSAFMKYGRPGPGRYITIYARSGHVFMEICGLRLDAGGSPSRDQRGPLWRTTSRDTDGWAVRHPPGF